MHAYTVSLEAKLKEPIPTSCSTCELHALKNLELAHYVDRLQNENDELRKMMGWLSGHEPQLRILIKTYKSRMVRDLGQTKLVMEVERISQSHQKPTTKMISPLNLTILGID
jgi:hypothetical protein